MAVGAGKKGAASGGGGGGGATGGPGAALSLLVLLAAVLAGVVGWQQQQLLAQGGAARGDSEVRLDNVKPVNVSVSRAPVWKEGRHPPEVTLMPGSARGTHGVSAEQLPFVELLGGPPERTKRERSMGARFRNFFPYDLTMWWDDGSEQGSYSGSVRSGYMSSTNTYTTHRFHFRNKRTGEHVVTLTMRDDEHLMLIGPDPDDAETLGSVKYRKALEEREFLRKFHAKTGKPWLSHYPPHLPALPFWPADFVGQKHKVRSFVGYHVSATEQSPEPVDLELTVVSTEPRVLLIPNLLSPFEIDHIIEAGLKVVKRSSVGSSDDAHESNTRTSDNGWLSRHGSPLMDRVYTRFADALGVSDDYMEEGSKGNLENLQFVRYKTGQKYEPHHDFGATGRPNQRFSTLFIYLRTPEQGGATSFPKAKPAGIKVKPPPGSAALFYSMTADGNGDDDSLHSGMEVESGTKLAANLWSWTPNYK